FVQGIQRYTKIMVVLKVAVSQGKGILSRTRFLVRQFLFHGNHDYVRNVHIVFTWRGGTTDEEGRLVGHAISAIHSRNRAVESMDTDGLQRLHDGKSARTLYHHWKAR